MLTSPQKKHIQDKHPDDYELLEKHHSKIFKSPDYILKDHSDEKSVLYVKDLKEKGAEKTKNVKVLLRLSVGDKEKNKDNSIITFHRLSDKTAKKLIKKNIILYKKK